MKILTLTGPSCSGKTTLLNELVENHGFQSIISHTTRPMRPGEIEGKDYYFISDDHFDNKLVDMDFIESITFNGFSYGVSLDELAAAERAGKKAVLIVEPTGLAQMFKFISNKPSIEIKSVYIGGDTLALIERYLARTAGEDMGAEGVAKRHAKRIQSLIKEKELWKPWTMTLTGTDPLKNPGSLPYNIIFEKLDFDNFEAAIKQINELEFK
jgi:guanylate kinase